jgi:hypothetical protein
MNAPTAKITLGRHGLRLIAGEVRRTIARSAVLGIDRIGARAALIYRAPDQGGAEILVSAEFDDSDQARAIEDWLLDGMPGELTAAAPASVEPAKPKPAEEIGPGSIVEYLGQVYEVSREAHDGDVRRWRLAGHLSRGVNESALRLVTPFRKGDRVIIGTVDGTTDRTGMIDQAHFGFDGRGFLVRLDDGSGNSAVRDADILHASRDLPDGTVAVIR